MIATEPVGLDFAFAAPVHLQATHTIDASPDLVFEVLADTPRWPEWFTILKSARWTSEPPHGVGSTRTVEVGPLRIDERIIAWEPGVRWGFCFVATSLPWVRAAAEVIDLLSVDGATVVTHHMHLDPLPGLRLPTRILAPAIRRGLLEGLHGLDRKLSTP